MSIIWTDPPIEMRRATDEGDYAVAFLPIRVDGTEGLCCIFRMPDIHAARRRLSEILASGDMGRIYNKEGTPI
jgi:hypothetical protein